MKAEPISFAARRGDTHQRFTDEELKFWGDKFVKSPLRRRTSMTFGSFMAMTPARRERMLKFGECGRAALALPVVNPVVRCRSMGSHE